MTEIGTIIASMIREYDIAGRFGGEEFCIIMLESGPDEAAVMAERIRATIEEAAIKVDNHAEPIRATMSFGIASYPSHATSAQELLHQADLAVYRAKAGGRNRVCVANPGNPHDIEAAEVGA